MYTSHCNTVLSQRTGPRLLPISPGHGRQYAVLLHHSSSSRFVPIRAVRSSNPELADRTKEYWDDEEDIHEAVERLGINKVQQGQDSTPLLSKVNQMYLKKTFADGFIGPLEIRHIQGKGYGLVAAKDIPKGTLLAICQPLAWLSGQPGSPPKLEALIQHMKDSSFTEAQMNALLSLCSLPSLDQAHEQQQQRQQQQERQDRLLKAGRELEESQQVPGLKRKGPAVSSYSISKSKQLKEMQRKIMQERGLDWQDDAGSSSSTELSRVAAGQQRRTPDLLELLECTKDSPAAAAAAAAAAATAATTGSRSSSNSSRWGRGSDDMWGGGSTALQHGSSSRMKMSLDRLTALVMRNAHSEMCQDLPVCSIREDIPQAITGIWPLLALFNHSCAPNTVAVMVGEIPLRQEQPQQQQLLPKQHQQQMLASNLSSKPSSAPVNRWAQNKLAAAPGKQPSGRALFRTGSSSSSSTALIKPGPAGGGVSSRAAGVGPVILVRAIADLSAGDEVCVDYLSPGVEGSLVHTERRRESLLLRWGFTCRCERCISEGKLGPVINRFQMSANSLTAHQGPKVSAAVTEGDTETIEAAAAKLSRAVLEVEQQVNTPNIPPRVAAWAHASVYQAHALLAVTRMQLEPDNMRSLATVGTAMEVAGITLPGCTAHMLGAAALVVAAEEAWGEEDARVNGAGRALIEVLQMRYGPLEAEAAQKLAFAAQHWAQQLLGSRLGLVAPAAATAARARAATALALKRRAAAAAESSSSSGVGELLRKDTSAAAGAGSSSSVEDDLEDDQVASALELEADEILEVTDEVLNEYFGEDDAAAADDDDEVRTVAQQADDVEPFTEQVKMSDVKQDLELYSGYATAALSPEERQDMMLRYLQQQHDGEQGDALPQGLQQQRDQQETTNVRPANYAAAGNGSSSSSNGGDDIMDIEAESAIDEEAVDLPMFAYLQGNSAADGDVPDVAGAAAGAASPAVADALAAAAAAATGGSDGAALGRQQPAAQRWAAAAAAAAAAAKEVNLGAAAAAAGAAAADARQPGAAASRTNRAAAQPGQRGSISSSGGGGKVSGRVPGRSLRGVGATGSFFSTPKVTAGQPQQQQQNGQVSPPIKKQPVQQKRSSSQRQQQQQGKQAQ